MSECLLIVVISHFFVNYFVIVMIFVTGEYAMLEHENVKGVVESLKVVTAEKSKRIAKFAFDYATRNGRKKVTELNELLTYWFARKTTRLYLH